MNSGATWATVGGIYSDQKCAVCGSKFRDDHRKALKCPDHPEQTASKFRVKFPGVSCKRFQSYQDAKKTLNGWRYKRAEGTYDPRDYRKDQPLGFESLALKYLERKRGIASYRHIKNHLSKAINYWRGKNIKDIGYPELEDFLFQLPEKLAGKTKYNIMASLHAFWMWLKKRRVLRLDQIPEFPEVKFELGWRKIVGKDDQLQILDEVRRLAEPVNFKIWVGVKWLATYISIRPKEMLSIKEGYFNLDLGIVFIRNPKEKKAKAVPLLPEDIEIVKSLPKAILPRLYFFRHGPGLQGVKAGEPFGPRLFYKYWKRACKNLGIEGVDLYGGTKHSSATALRLHRSPEEIKRATMHSTNKAFDRYFQISLDDLREVYADTKVTPEKVSPEKGKLLKLQN